MYEKRFNTEYTEKTWKARKKNFAFAFFMFVFSLGNLSAVEDGRPLRSVAPDSSLPLPTNKSEYRFNPAANSLLTERALSQPLTQHFIAQYTNAHGIATLNAILERSSLYMPFIKYEIQKRGLPPELAYLPIIESGFQITARSKSGAMGLWQFMMNSISPYNMRVTDLIDERRDFVKSTMGALQKLEDEHSRLGCWELTLAAYNMGFNGVTRIIQRTGIRDYWELVSRRELRPETLNFVAKLVAVSYVVSNHRKYGINRWQESFEWTTIPPRRQVSIDIIAEETGIDRNLLRGLNAELLHGISPVDPDYKLKIPAAYLDKISALLEREDFNLVRYRHHVIRQGDTLWSLSRQYGTTVNMIEQHNPGLANRVLRIGETVLIPAYPNASSQAVTAQRAAATSVRQLRGSHVVQSGESFWSLSRHYGIEPQALADANGMSLSETLHAGRTLNVPIME